MAAAVALTTTLMVGTGDSAAAGTWRSATPPPGTRGGTAVTLTDGRALVVYPVTEYESEPGRIPGEYVVTGEKRHLQSELYDAALNAWTQGPSPPGQDASTLVALGDGGALLLGETRCEKHPEVLGQICIPTTSAYILTPGATGWSAAEPMLVARTRPATVVLREGRVFVAGGFGDSCRPTELSGWSCAPVAGAELFDPASGTWTRLPPIPYPKGEASAAVLSDGSVLIAGGGSVLRYHPRTNDWTIVPSAPSPVGCSRLLPLPGDRAIAFGSGCEGGFDGSNGTAETRAIKLCESFPEIYSAAHNSWTPAPPLLGATPFSCTTEAALLPGDQVLYDGQVLDSRQHCWSPAPGPLDNGFLLPLLNGNALSLRFENPAAAVYTESVAGCTPAQAATSKLFEQLVPPRALEERAVLSPHGYRVTLSALPAGTMRVRWYAPGESGEGNLRMQLAQGRSVSRGSGRPVLLTMHVTMSQRTELVSKLRNGYVKLFAEATFNTPGGESTSVTWPFVVTSESDNGP